MARGPGIKIRVDPRQLLRMKSRLNRMRLAAVFDFPGAVEQVAAETAARIRQLTPGDILSAGWGVRDRRRTLTGTQTFVVEHAESRRKKVALLLKVLEYGAKPHVIRAMKARMLAFEINNVTIFRREVMHPGSQPHAMVRTASTEAELKLEIVMRRMQSAYDSIWSS